MYHMNVNVNLTVKVVIKINIRIKINVRVSGTSQEIMCAKKIIFEIMLHEVMKIVDMRKSLLEIQ